MLEMLPKMDLSQIELFDSIQKNMLNWTELKNQNSSGVNFINISCAPFAPKNYKAKNNQRKAEQCT